jgi:hypothetical protein
MNAVEKAMGNLAAALLEQDAHAAGLAAQCLALKEALKPFAAMSAKVEQFVEGTVRFGGSPVLPTKDLRLSHFVNARKALEHGGAPLQAPAPEGTQE